MESRSILQRLQDLQPRSEVKDGRNHVDLYAEAPPRESLIPPPNNPSITLCEEYDPEKYKQQEINLQKAIHRSFR